MRLSRDASGKPRIWDAARGRFVALTPEEWVRQHFLHYLMQERGFPRGLLSLEAGVAYHQRKGRYDALWIGRDGKPLLLVECKAPHVHINQETFDQVARYNHRLQAPYVAVTNGIAHYYMRIDFHGNQVFFLDDMPHYQYLAP
jgi:hypothetical protein